MYSAFFIGAIAVNTRTIEEILSNIERGLYLAAGTDVQIHAEDTLLFALHSAYTMFIEDSFAYSNLHYRTDKVDRSTGKIIGTYAPDCTSFNDIHSIYADEENRPLQRVSPRSNPKTLRQGNLVIEDSDRTKLFRLINCNADEVSIWYRKRLPESVWTDHRIETVVDVDALLLTYQVMHQFLVDEDSNDKAIQNAAMNVATRKKQLLDREWQIAFSKNKQSSGILTHWA